MRPTFSPRLINAPFDDPGLFIPLRFEKRALLFDLGDLHRLTARELLKVSHVFVTHAHMDHFIGFDALLRLNLGRDRQLRLYGPAGIQAHVAGRLAGYRWNLVSPDSHPFVLEVTEVLPDQRLTIRYPCGHGFCPVEPPMRHAGVDAVLLQEPQLTVRTALLDHQIPCLALALQESVHIHIRREALDDLGLEPGPWLTRFRSALLAGVEAQRLFQLPSQSGASEASPRALPVGELTQRIARIAAGQKLVYITDAAWSPANAARMVALAQAADQLFIEAAFLERDSDIAQAKAHLTAHQAGLIAGWSGARQVRLFHHSPRYANTQSGLFEAEAERAMVLARAGVIAPPPIPSAA